MGPVHHVGTWRKGLTDFAATVVKVGLALFFLSRAAAKKNGVSAIQQFKTLPPRTRPEDRPTSFKADSSLLWKEPTTSRELKRKLDVFEDSTRKSRKLTGEIHQARFDKLKPFKDLLGAVGKKTCGFCLARRVHHPAEHDMEGCRTATKQEKEIFENIRVNYTEEKKNPCYRCHIAALGTNALHADFVKGQVVCTHPNLLLPLAFGIYSDPRTRQRAEEWFKPKGGWATLKQFIIWFATLHDDWKSNGMALLKWFSEWYFQNR